MTHHSPTILLVEDASLQRSYLGSCLKKQGYQVATCNNGQEARRFLDQHWADLLLLDRTAPVPADDQLLRWVRSRNATPLPVICQSMRDDENDIAAALHAGADDYLIHPYSPALLNARIGAVLRRYGKAPSPQRSLAVGGVTLDQADRQISTGQREERLCAKLFGIAWQLATSVGDIVVRKKLIGAVWGLDATIEARSVDMYVSRLRTKLRQLEIDTLNIHSVYGVGYRMDLVRTGGGATG